MEQDGNIVGGPLHIEDLAPVLRCIVYHDPAYKAWLASLSPWRRRLHHAWGCAPYWVRHPTALPTALKEWLVDSWYEAQDLCRLPSGYPWTPEERAEHAEAMRRNMENIGLLVRALEAGRLGA